MGNFLSKYQIKISHEHKISLFEIPPSLNASLCVLKATKNDSLDSITQTTYATNNGAITQVREIFFKRSHKPKGKEATEIWR